MIDIRARKVSGSGAAPTVSIEPVVKLETSGPGFNDHGTGFVLSEPGWGNFVVTARHVVWRSASQYATTIRVFGKTKNGADVPLLAKSVAHDHARIGQTGADSAIVCIEQAPQLLSGNLADPPPSTTFDGEARGFQGGSHTLSQQSVTGADWDAATQIITYGNSLQGFQGFSGGPLIFGGKVVGIHASNRRAAELRFDPDLNEMMTKAWAAR